MIIFTALKHYCHFIFLFWDSPPPTTWVAQAGLLLWVKVILLSQPSWCWEYRYYEPITPLPAYWQYIDFSLLMVWMWNLPHRLLCWNTWSLQTGTVPMACRSLGEAEPNWRKWVLRGQAWSLKFSSCPFCFQFCWGKRQAPQHVQVQPWSSHRPSFPDVRGLPPLKLCARVNPFPPLSGFLSYLVAVAREEK